MHTRAFSEAAADFRRPSFRFDAGSSRKAMACWIPVASKTPQTPTTHGNTCTLHPGSQGRPRMAFARSCYLVFFCSNAARMLCLLQVNEGACPSGEGMPTPRSWSWWVSFSACSPSVGPSARLDVLISTSTSSPASGSVPSGAGESSKGLGRSLSTESYGQQYSQIATFPTIRLTATKSDLSLRRFRRGRYPCVSSGAPSRAGRAFGGSPKGQRRSVSLIGLSM
jgi:hypothetical protein